MANNDLTVDEDGKVLATYVSAEIDTQVSTAKAYPRSIAKFTANATTLATLNEEIAGDCVYSLPRGKHKNGTAKFIEGASIRMAEIVLHAYGNARAGARIIATEQKFVTAQGVFHDLETNTVTTIEVSRRIVDKYGKRYNDDMIVMTGNAACSFAIRNAILRGVPKALWKPIEMEARKAMIGTQATIVETRTKLLNAYMQLGVDQSIIFDFLEIEDETEINLSHIKILRPLYTAVRDGDIKSDVAFGVEKEAKGSGSNVKKSDLNDKLKTETTEPKPEPEPVPEPVQPVDELPPEDEEGEEAPPEVI